MKSGTLLIVICSTCLVTFSSLTSSRRVVRGATLPAHLRTQEISNHEKGTHLLSFFDGMPLAEGENASGELKTSQEPEPESGTNTNPSSTPEGNKTAEAEPETEPEPETWPEPGPLWSEAFKKWKSAWAIHVYLFATCYVLLALYAAYYVVFNVYDGLNKKYLSVSLNIMVLLFGLSRALVMFLDPYHQGTIINALQVMRLLWSIGGPCLTAADSLIILALLEVCQLRIALPSLQSAPAITIIVTLHFFFVIVTDFVVSEYVSAKGMILFCQVFYMVWGFVLGTGYMKLGYVLDKQLFSHKPVKDKEDKLYIFLIYASGAVNYALVSIMLYTGVGVFGVYSNVKFVDAWSWWSLQTLFRFSEVVTCVLIFTVSAKRTRITKAMDDISNMVSQVPNNSRVERLTTLQKLHQRLKRNKKILVEPCGSMEETILDGPVPVPRIARKMSMFSDMENSSKIVQEIKRIQRQTENKNTGDKNTPKISWQSVMPRNNNKPSKMDLNQAKTHQKIHGAFFSVPRSCKKSRAGNCVEIHDILEETSELDDSLFLKKLSVRKISAEVIRRLSHSRKPIPFDTAAISAHDSELPTADTYSQNNAGFESDDMNFVNCS